MLYSPDSEVGSAGPIEIDLVSDGHITLSRRQLAVQDLVAGFKRSWMWTALAFQDMRLRYRGSVLGPFWLTLSTLAMAVGMGFIYARLFSMRSDTYLPYLTLGLILWQFIAGMVGEGCDTFLKAEGMIRQVPIPFSVHVYRGVFRNFLVLLHNLIIVPLGWIIFRIEIGWQALEIIPAIILLMVNGCWISFLLGLLSARFRDVPPIVANLLQMAFFLTPVFWPLEALGRWAELASLNPFFAAIDVIRAPLLGIAVHPNSWLVLVIVTLAGSGVTFLLFSRFRSRIAYWI